MKNRWNRALALLMALMLTIAAVALAEEATVADGAAGEPVEIEAAEIESEVEEMGEIALDDLADIPAEDTPIAEEPAGGDATEAADWNGVETWWFLVGDNVVATQEAREGDEILRPEDPAAPESMTFDGWYFEDGTPLLADANGDGEIDAVIAHPDPLIPDVNVFAQFVEAEEPAEEPTNEEPVTEEPAAEEPTTEEPAMEEPAAEELATEEPVAEEPTAEEPTAEEPATEEPAAEESVAEEPAAEEPTAEEPVTEESAAEELADEEVLPVFPTANELTYTGEAQALVSGEGWLYSLDSEAYSEEIPAAVNAGEYAVYFKTADDAEAQILTVTVAKADVVFTPPVAATGDE